MEILEQALEAARTFRPLTEAEVDALLAKTAKAAARGEFELVQDHVDLRRDGHEPGVAGRGAGAGAAGDAGVARASDAAPLRRPGLPSTSEAGREGPRHGLGFAAVRRGGRRRLGLRIPRHSRRTKLRRAESRSPVGRPSRGCRAARLRWARWCTRRAGGTCPARRRRSTEEDEVGRPRSSPRRGPSRSTRSPRRRRASSSPGRARAPRRVESQAGSPRRSTCAGRLDRRRVETRT